MILLRSAMENYLLLDYLSENQNIVENFYNVKIELSHAILAKHARKKNNDFGPLWGMLCNMYVHSNMSSLHTTIEPSKNPEHDYVRLLPYYEKESTRFTLLYAAFFKLMTLTPLATIFADEMRNGQALLHDVAEFRQAFFEILEDPQLQIDFDGGDPRNF